MTDCSAQPFCNQLSTNTSIAEEKRTKFSQLKVENKETEFVVWVEGDASEDSLVIETDQRETLTHGTEQIPLFAGQWPRVEVRKITRKWGQHSHGWKSASVLELLLKPEPDYVCGSVPQLCGQKVSL